MVSPPETVAEPARLSLTVGLKLPGAQVPPFATAVPPQVEACAVPADSAASATPATTMRSEVRHVAACAARRLAQEALRERLPRARAVSATATQQPVVSLHIDRNE